MPFIRSESCSFIWQPNVVTWKDGTVREGIEGARFRLGLLRSAMRSFSTPDAEIAAIRGAAAWRGEPCGARSARARPVRDRAARARRPAASAFIAGCTPSAIRRLTGRGRWLAAVLACGPGAALSHRSAAALWGLRPTAAAKVDVTVPRDERPAEPRRDRRPPAAAGRAGDGRGRDSRSRRPGARCSTWRPCSGAARAGEGGRDGRGAAARRRRRPRPPRRAPARGRAGARPRLHHAQRARGRVPRAVRAARHRAAAREPRGGRRTRSTSGGPTQRLVVEVDGFEHHGTRAAFERDRARDARLTATGARVLRFSYLQVLEQPAATAVALVISARSPSPATPV